MVQAHNVRECVADRRADVEKPHCAPPPPVLPAHELRALRTTPQEASESSFHQIIEPKARPRVRKARSIRLRGMISDEPKGVSDACHVSKSISMSHTLHSTARIGGHPIHPMLVPIPIACFVGALLTDLMYWRTAAMQWANFSAWLVTVGVIVGWVAAIVGLIDFLGNRFVRAQPPAWPHFIGNAVALTVATFNMLIHSRDAWTSAQG